MKDVISTDLAPEAIGPYSQAIKSGGFLFVSGQIPVKPETGSVLDGTIGTQSTQVMENLKAVVEGAGLSLENVVKCTCFLTDLGDFDAFNKVYGGYFPENPPGRECIEVSRLPKDVMVEVSAICDASESRGD